MKKELIKQIEQQMAVVLNNAQNEKLHEVLEHELYAVEIIIKQQDTGLSQAKTNEELLVDFLAAKHVEGCSERSISYYKSTLEKSIKILEKPLNQTPPYRKRWKKQDDEMAKCNKLCYNHVV